MNSTHSRSNFTGALSALALCAGVAFAQPTFSISGTPSYAVAAGSVQVLTIAQQSWSATYSTTLGPNRFLSFDVGATNLGGTNFSLGLSNFAWRTDQPVEQITLTFSQDFEWVGVPTWLGSHAVEGDFTFGPGASGNFFLRKHSRHENTELPVLVQQFNLPTPILLGQGAPTIVLGSGTIYSIVSTLNLTLSSSGGWTQVELAQGTSKMAVPAPAGAALFAFALAARACRARRKPYR